MKFEERTPSSGQPEKIQATNIFFLNSCDCQTKQKHRRGLAASAGFNELIQLQVFKSIQILMQLKCINRLKNKKNLKMAKINKNNLRPHHFRTHKIYELQD